MKPLSPTLQSIEAVGIVVVEMFAPPVTDDILEHELHDLKKLFKRDFSRDKSVLLATKSFCVDVVKSLKKDMHLVKSIMCFHPTHAHAMKNFVERSLIKNGFETLTSTAIVSIIGIETLPVVVGGVILEQVLEQLEEKFEPQIKSKISSLRQHSDEKTNPLQVK